jgi:hypothetical protein
VGVDGNGKELVINPPKFSKGLNSFQLGSGDFKVCALGEENIVQ